MFLVVASGCGSSADQPTDRVSICNRGRANACQRIADCEGAAPSNPATVAFVTMCTATTQANECTADLLVCPPTETYHLDQDLACASGFSQWDCAAVLAAGDHFPAPPAPCQMICQ